MDNEQIASRLTATEIRTEQNTKDIDELSGKVEAIDNKQDNLNKISTSIEIIATNMGYVKDDIKQVKMGQTEMKAEIAEIRSMPCQDKAKKWDKVVSYNATTVGSGLLAWLHKRRQTGFIVS